jgi:predicted DNA-binding transcriptional regulator YafY
VDRTERFYRIRQRLVEKGALTRREIEEDLEISHATFKRDLEYLRDRLNVPILWSRERNAYVLDPQAEQSELPGVWFSPGEIYALLEIDHLLGSRRCGRGSRLSSRAATMATARSAAASACSRSAHAASTARCSRRSRWRCLDASGRSSAT